MPRRFQSGSIVVTLLCLFGASELALKFIPIPSALLRPPVQSISLLDRTGLPLREARVADRFSRELALADVPSHVIDAILAAEDKRFYSHHGIDCLATGRPARAGLTHVPIGSRAST